MIYEFNNESETLQKKEMSLPAMTSLYAYFLYFEALNAFAASNNLGTTSKASPTIP